MRKYLTDYRNYITEILKNETADWEKILTVHLAKIQFFQHERIVHLLVLILFAMMTLGSLIAFVIVENLGLLALTVLFIVLLIPYIRHYYFLENQTQELYKDYDKIIEKINSQE